MKKLVLSICLGCLFLGCAHDSAMNSKNSTVAGQNVKAEVIKFKTENGKILTLTSSDDFETAVLSDGVKEYNLVIKPSGSGTYMENENGQSIHFKAKEGIVEFKKYDSIPVEVIE